MRDSSRRLGSLSRRSGSRPGRSGKRTEGRNADPDGRDRERTAGMETRAPGMGKRAPGSFRRRREGFKARGAAPWSAGPWTLAAGRPYTGEAAFRDAGSLGRGGSLKIEVRQEGGGPARPPGVPYLPVTAPLRAGGTILPIFNEESEGARMEPRTEAGKALEVPPERPSGCCWHGCRDGRERCGGSRCDRKPPSLEGRCPSFSRRCAMVHNTDAFDDLPCFHAHQ